MMIVLALLPMTIFAQNKTTELDLQMTEKGFPFVECNLGQFGTLYNISKTFSIPLTRIQDANGINDATEVQADKMLRVPINTDLLRNNFKSGVKLFYTVRPGETLYRIAKVYFKREVKDVMQLNGMTDGQLQLGKRLLIGYYLSESSDVPQEVAVEEKPDTVVGPPVIWVKERGIALWNKVQSHSGKRFVLHGSAKINTDVELYNPHMRRSVRAKVVGRIPDGTYAKDIDIILSSATASALGALDARFMVEMRYAIPADQSISSAR